MGSYLIKDIPEELQRKFKASCVLRGTTMKEELIRFIREEVEKAKKGKLQ